MRKTAFKINGVVTYTYEPGFSKVPEFGVYVLGQPTPEVEMLEEIVSALESKIADMYEEGEEYQDG